MHCSRSTAAWITVAAVAGLISACGGGSHAADEVDVLVTPATLDGGACGVRDAGLLASALARPQQHRAYADAPDIVRLAALSTHALLPYAECSPRKRSSPSASKTCSAFGENRTNTGSPRSTSQLRSC